MLKYKKLSQQGHQQLIINEGDNMVELLITEGITEEHLQEIYSDPYILNVGHDQRPAAYIDHPNLKYLSAWISGKFAGAFMAIKFNALEYELHSLLKKTSIKYSRYLGKLFIDWAFSHDSVTRVTAYVIEGLGTAKNYCLKLGFIYEGAKRDACIKEGKIRKIHMLGITRAEWGAAWVS